MLQCDSKSSCVLREFARYARDFIIIVEQKREGIVVELSCNLATRVKIDRLIPTEGTKPRTHLKGRILRGDLRETDYVAEVNGHRLVVLRWHLMDGKIYKFMIVTGMRLLFLFG